MSELVRDLLIIGDVITLDDHQPRVAAIAIADGRVVALGDLREVRRSVPAATPALEVSGTVVPGFVDSHVHLMWAGRRSSRLSLDGVKGIVDLQDHITAFHRSHPGPEWIEADAGFDLGDLREGRLPTAEELEGAAPGRPVFLDRKGHDAVVNLTALRLAGITAGTPDPVGGRIERTSDGRATGLLIEQPAVALVRAVMPEPDIQTKINWIDAGTSELLRHGITAAVDPAVRPDDLAAFPAALRAGRLGVRTVVMPLGDAGAGDADLDHAVTRSGLLQSDPNWLRRGPTKLFLDGGGSLGTAWRSEPWPGTASYGQQSLETDVLRAHCRAAAAAGRGVGIHAVGDAAIDIVLEVLAIIDRSTPIAGLGFHLIHAYLGPSDRAMAAARRLGVTVSAHPGLQWQYGRDLVHRLGATEAAAANPLRRWLDAGVTIGGGSDAPGTPLSVLHGMWQARTRQVRGLDHPLGPDQAITADEALRLFTTGAAQVAGLPDSGRLTVDGPGDATILDVDPLDPDPSVLASGQVLGTVVDGTIR